MREFSVLVILVTEEAGSRLLALKIVEDFYNFIKVNESCGLIERYADMAAIYSAKVNAVLVEL